ncbi:MAG TPA: copper transporter [Jatrophihabitantaceae bacterium]
MISFRYHIVSIIAVFLALALGIVVGTTALNGPITKDLRHQVDSLKNDRNSLSDQVKQLQGQVGNDQKFADMYTSQIVKGRLLDSNVLIIGLPGASGAVKDGLAKVVADAGGKVTGKIQLTGDYTDPKQAGAIMKFATGGNIQPIGLTYPSTEQAGPVAGALLAYVLLGKGQPSDLKAVIAGFSTMSMLQGADGAKPATSVIVVTDGTMPVDDARGQTDLALITQLQQHGGHVVVAGDTPAATDGGVVALVRGDTADKATVATVDNADTALGRVSTIMALADVGQPNTIVGHYGTAGGAKALFPNLPK